MSEPEPVIELALSLHELALVTLALTRLAVEDELRDPARRDPVRTAEAIALVGKIADALPDELVLPASAELFARLSIRFDRDTLAE